MPSDNNTIKNPLKCVFQLWLKNKLNPQDDEWAFTKEKYISWVKCFFILHVLINICYINISNKNLKKKKVLLIIFSIQIIFKSLYFNFLKFLQHKIFIGLRSKEFYSKNRLNFSIVLSLVLFFDFWNVKKHYCDNLLLNFLS